MRRSHRWFVSVGIVLALSLALVATTLASGPVKHSSKGGSASYQAQQSPLASPLALIPDGDFEADPGSDAWNEVDTTSCTPWIGDWSSIIGISAYSGSQYLWTGGYCNDQPNSNYAEQSLAIPAGMAMLSFRYYADRVDPDSATPNDVAYVKVNGTVVWQIDMTTANNTDGWVQQMVDLTAYEGQTVTLQFGAQNSPGDDGAGNVHFDYVELMPTAPTAVTLGSLTSESGRTLPGASLALLAGLVGIAGLAVVRRRVVR